MLLWSSRTVLLSLFLVGVRRLQRVSLIVDAMRVFFPQEEAFFLAQLFLAIAAPLLFSRVLFLAQIDENLGLMVQVRGTGRFGFGVRDWYPSPAPREQVAKYSLPSPSWVGA